jgi:hypothetical protein
MSKNDVYIPEQDGQPEKAALELEPTLGQGFRSFAQPPGTDDEDANDGGITEPTLMVMFACGGLTLAMRKKCTCYEKDEEDNEFGDCAGLKQPKTGVRNGLCWSFRAMVDRSARFLNLVQTANPQPKTE